MDPATGNLIHMYIESLQDSRKGARDMLLDAYNKRNAILILDGLVRASMIMAMLRATF